jgi:hypothetical protein
MPKISELPSDNAPDPLDIVPYTDVSAGTTDRSTWAGVAASSAFTSQYAPLTGSTAYEPIREGPLFIPAPRFTAVVGSAAISGTTVVGHPMWLLDQTSNEAVGTWLHIGTDIPSHWVTFSIDYVYVNAGAGSGDVQWQINGVEANSYSEGDTIAALGTSAAVTDTAAAQNVIKYVQMDASVTLPAEDFMAVRVSRNGASGSDTLANDVGFLGLELTRLT